MKNVVVLMGKYLQMLVAYSIHKEDPDQVTEHYEQFNSNYMQMCDAFKEVTQQVFKAGQEIDLMKKPVAPVRPTQRESKPEFRLSDSQVTELQQFLERHNLSELLTLFLKEGVALTDVFELTDEEMKELGIKTFAQRKRLLRFVFDFKEYLKHSPFINVTLYSSKSGRISNLITFVSKT